MRRALAAAAISVVLTGALVAAPVGGASAPASAARIRALVAASVTISSLTPALTADVQLESQQTADLVYKIPFTCLKANTCILGDRHAKATVVLFGDSHVRMWLPALIGRANADHFRIVIVGEDGCPAVHVTFPSSFATCRGVLARALGETASLHPSVVIVADRTTWLSSIPQSAWRSGFLYTLKSLEKTGAAIAVMGDIHIFATPILTCLVIHPHHVQECSITNPAHQTPTHASAERSAAAAAHVAYVDPTPWLCTSTACSAVIGPFIAYSDSFHVSVPYVKYLSGVVDDALAATLRPLSGSAGQRSEARVTPRA